MYPPRFSCCGSSAEALFEEHAFRPAKIIDVDRESITRRSVAEGAGVGLLHPDTAKSTIEVGDVSLICDMTKSARVLFSFLPDGENNCAACHFLQGLTGELGV